MERRYVIVDVFTDRPLAGNPLAVVLDGAGLGVEQMQAIAGEFNLSETVFVTSISKDRLAADIRIFTPASELPFAGHPTVGTAVILAIEADKNGKSNSPEEIDIVLEEKVGTVRCRVAIGDAGAAARFTLPKLPTMVGPAGSSQNIAAALGLPVEAIGFDNYQPGVWTGGTPFSMVPLASLKALQEIEIQADRWAAAFGEGDHDNAYVFCRECEQAANSFHTRMFWPGAGIVEDPATGGAAAAFIGMITQNEVLDNGANAFVIELGFEMGRPSILKLELNVVNGQLVSAAIGGDVAMVARGVLSI